jgi:tRNA dimethylallyltransferase
VADNLSYPLLVIVGETASGKSALALHLAQLFNAEIICADSATVRQKANIGTAKPTQKERSLVRHHLLDIVGPDERFTVADFQKMAYMVMDQIATRGKMSIMVGGTGLYVDSVLYDYSFLPATDHKDLDRLDLDSLIKKACDMKLDLTAVDSHNKRRLIRYIQTNGEKPTKHELRPDTLILGTRISRDLLSQNIAARIDRMLADGLEDEVRGLISYGWDSEILKCVGYAQWKGYFDGHQTIDETKELIQKASLNLAKRQRTWFKRNKSIHWIDTPVHMANIVDTVTTFLNS